MSLCHNQTLTLSLRSSSDIVNFGFEAHDRGDIRTELQARPNFKLLWFYVNTSTLVNVCVGLLVFTRHRPEVVDIGVNTI